jgi:DNA-3-methyladenine glycosylase I
MVQSTSPEATAMSMGLTRRGWAFVGPTNVYAFMPAVRLVNDHLSGCFARDEVEQARRAFRRPG